MADSATDLENYCRRRSLQSVSTSNNLVKKILNMKLKFFKNLHYDEMIEFFTCPRFYLPNYWVTQAHTYSPS